MERIVKHMQIYFFDEDVPPIPAIENLVYEIFYNEDGLEVKREIIDEIVESRYEKMSNDLISQVHDYPDGRREVTTYTYDHESNLVCCHFEEQMAYDGYGKIVLVPTGTYSNEWYDWSNDGKTCVRTKENHYADGTSSKELRREEYNDLGWLRRVHHFDKDFRYECFEAMHRSYPEGKLIQKTSRTIFTTKDGEKREIYSKERFSDDRIIYEDNYGANAEGNVFSNTCHYEYEDDKEGNWIISRKLKNGKVQCTVVREIDYWQ